MVLILFGEGGRCSRTSTCIDHEAVNAKQAGISGTCVFVVYWSSDLKVLCSNVNLDWQKHTFYNYLCFFNCATCAIYESVRVTL